MVALPANEGYLVQSEQHQLQSQGHRESSRSTWSREFQRIQNNIGFFKHSTHQRGIFKNFSSTLHFLNIQHQHGIFKNFNTTLYF